MGTFIKYLILLVCTGCIALPAAGQNKVNVPFEASNANPADSHYFHALMYKMHGEFKLAEQEFKRFVSRGKHNSAANFHLAEIAAYVDNNYKSALRYSKRAYESDTNNKWYRIQYADNLAHNNQFKKGAQLYAGLTGMHDHQEEYYMRQMQFQWQLARYDIVLDLIDSMGKYTIQDQDYLDLLRIEVYDAMHDTTNLEKVLIRRINHSPDAKDRQLLLFKFYELTGQSDKADAMQETFAAERGINDENEMTFLAALFSRNDSATLRTIIKDAFLSPGDTVAIKNLFGLLSSSGSSNLGMTYFFVNELRRWVHEEEVHFLGSEFLSRLYYNLNNKDSSLVYAEMSVKAGNKDPNIFYFLAEHYYEQAEFDKALRTCKLWVAIEEEASQPYFIQGATLYQKNEYEESIQSLHKAIANLNRNENGTESFLAGVYFFLVANYSVLEDSVNIRKAYDSLIKFSPNDPLGLNNYAYWLVENTEELDLALSLSARSLEISPDEPSYLDTYAWILYKQGHYEEARRYQRRAVALASDDPQAILFEHLGDIEIKLGNKKEALANWRKALKVVGGNEVLSEKIKSHE